MLQNVRQQTTANEAFISDKLKKWLEVGIIKKVSSRYWSQVHIVNMAGKSPVTLLPGFELVPGEESHSNVVHVF
jgi:hypothetical protein